MDLNKSGSRSQHFFLIFFFFLLPFLFSSFSSCCCCSSSSSSPPSPSSHYEREEMFWLGKGLPCKFMYWHSYLKCVKMTLGNSSQGTETWINALTWSKYFTGIYKYTAIPFGQKKAAMKEPTTNNWYWIPFQFFLFLFCFVPLFCFVLFYYYM